MGAQTIGVRGMTTLGSPHTTAYGLSTFNSRDSKRTSRGLELRIMQCANTNQLNISQLHEYYGWARMRSDLLRHVRVHVRTGFKSVAPSGPQDIYQVATETAAMSR